MAINKLISIKVPILEAFEDMGLDHVKLLPSFTRWAVRAEREIGSYYSFKRKIAVIKVDQFRAEIPCDAVYVQRVLLGDYGCDSADLFSLVCNSLSGTTTFNQTDTFLVIDNPEGENAVSVGDFKWEVQDNHIVLSHNYHEEKLTIQYLGLETDDDGFPKVGENHVEAIIEYIMYRYAKRSRFTANRMDIGDVIDLRRQWSILAAEARAIDANISESDRDAIVALLNDPISGTYGMEVNMYNNND